MKFFKELILIGTLVVGGVSFGQNSTLPTDEGGELSYENITNLDFLTLDEEYDIRSQVVDGILIISKEDFEDYSSQAAEIINTNSDQSLEAIYVERDEKRAVLVNEELFYELESLSFTTNRDDSFFPNRGGGSGGLSCRARCGLAIVGGAIGGGLSGAAAGAGVGVAVGGPAGAAGGAAVGGTAGAIGGAATAAGTASACSRSCKD